MNRIKDILVVLIVSSILAFGSEKILRISNALKQCHVMAKDLNYFKEASLITDCLFRENLPSSAKTVKETIEQIDVYLPKYFPNGPFKREDFVAMAWLESGFNQYETGTHGEKGIFQIMPDEFVVNNIKNSKYDVNINTELCMIILKQKYAKYPDYKKAIIAYNGVVRSKHGRWNEKYWKAFERRRLTVETLFNS